MSAWTFARISMSLDRDLDVGICLGPRSLVFVGNHQSAVSVLRSSHAAIRNASYDRWMWSKLPENKGSLATRSGRSKVYGKGLPGDASCSWRREAGESGC